jgi:hypothetical protein
MTDPITGRPERPIRAPRGTALSCKGWPRNPEAIDAARRHGLNLPGVTRP